MTTKIGGRRPVRIYLREWMEKSGLNQEQLAGRLGIGPPTVSKDLKKGTKIHADRLAQYAHALDIDFIDLFRDPDAPTRDELMAAGTPEELRQAISLVRLAKTGTNG